MKKGQISKTMAWIFQVQEKKFEKNCALRLLGAKWEEFQALFSIQYFDLVLILKNHTTNQRRKVKSNSKLSYVKRNILVTGCMRKSQPNCEKDSNGRFNRTTQLLESGFIFFPVIILSSFKCCSSFLDDLQSSLQNKTWN